MTLANDATVVGVTDRQTDRHTVLVAASMLASLAG